MNFLKMHFLLKMRIFHPAMLVYQRVGPQVAGCNLLEATSHRNPGPYCHFELSREITRWGLVGMGVHEMVIQDGWKGWFGKDWGELCCDFCYTNNHHFTRGAPGPRYGDMMDSYGSLQLLMIFIFPLMWEKIRSGLMKDWSMGTIFHSESWRFLKRCARLQGSRNVRKSKRYLVLLLIHRNHCLVGCLDSRCWFLAVTKEIWWI